MLLGCLAPMILILNRELDLTKLLTFAINCLSEC
jgi:hypothetical protein